MGGVQESDVEEPLWQKCEDAFLMLRGLMTDDSCCVNALL